MTAIDNDINDTHKALLNKPNLADELLLLSVKNQRRLKVHHNLDNPSKK